MSYDEVERGLPPVNVVYSPLRTRPLPKFLRSQSDEDFEPDSTKSKGKTNMSHDMSVFRVSSRPRPSVTPDDLDSIEELDSMSRARKFGGFVLILLPPIWFALGVQFLKFVMANFQIWVLALCIFQGILWSCSFYLIYLVVLADEGTKVLKVIQCRIKGLKNIGELLILALFSSGALILQIISLQILDITVSLAISFSPLVISSFILHIHVEKSFSLELLMTTLMSYLGITLIAVPAVLLENEWKNQQQIIIGIGASVGSMLLAIPASVHISRLRRKKINDCLNGTFLGIVGSLVSILMGVLVITLDWKFISIVKIDTNPWKIVGLVSLIFMGTFFLIFEANHRKAKRRNINFSCTRAGIFILSGIWEILKHGFIPGQFFFPSVFSIFGVLMLMVSYLFTVSFKIWFDEEKDKQKVRKCTSANSNVTNLYFIPWLFSRKY